MSRYALHDLNEAEFEDLVTSICREIFGIAVTSFAPGPDGGRDAYFEGTAESFPSKTEPAKGKFVIQAKHAQSPIASCSDSSFKTTLLNKELPRVKRLFDDNKLTHYILFTNRKKTGGADEHFVDRMQQEAGVQHAWLRGIEDLERELLSNPRIVKNAGLDKLRSPLLFTPEDYRDVIEALYANRDAITINSDSEHDFKDYPGLQKKNQINCVSPTYDTHIREDSMPAFDAIESFLQNPRNEQLKEQYHAIANELKGQLIIHQNQFETFDEVLDTVPHLIQERSPELQHFARRSLLKIMIHYMYVNCDIGRKK
tara:strand:- start:2139 stop:3077 length:939 start_codon:yes stop_codon:yes gene_type:complete